MSKAARKAAPEAAQATGQTDSQVNSQATTTPAPVMQVLKPEPEQPAQPEQKPEKLSVYDVIRKVNEKFYLTEQHANQLQQLNKLHDFKSRINVNTCLKLINGGEGNDFTSNDPQAVEMMIGICIDNVKARISDIENQLLND